MRFPTRWLQPFSPQTENNLFSNPSTLWGYFEYIDRPTYSLQTALGSWKYLACTTTTSNTTTSTNSNIHARDKGDPDMLPPLVYQLGLLPMGLASSSSSAASITTDKRDNGKQRGMRLRRMVLEDIASVLDNDNDDATNLNGGDIVLLHTNSTAATASVGTSSNSVNNNEAEEPAWRWAKSTSLTQLGSTLRSDPIISSSSRKKCQPNIPFGTSV